MEILRIQRRAVWKSESQSDYSDTLRFTETAEEGRVERFVEGEFFSVLANGVPLLIPKTEPNRSSSNFRTAGWIIVCSARRTTRPVGLSGSVGTASEAGKRRRAVSAHGFASTPAGTGSRSTKE